MEPTARITSKERGAEPGTIAVASAWDEVRLPSACWVLMPVMVVSSAKSHIMTRAVISVQRGAEGREGEREPQ